MLSLIKFNHHSSLPLLLQTEAAECGLACLGMVAGYHGHSTDLLSLRRKFAISLKGATLDQLVHFADKLHLSSMIFP